MLSSPAPARDRAERGTGSFVWVKGGIGQDVVKVVKLIFQTSWWCLFSSPIFVRKSNLHSALPVHAYTVGSEINFLNHSYRSMA